MTYEIYISSITALEADAKKFSNKMRTLKGSSSCHMGLTPDEIKFSLEFQKAKRGYNAFHEGIRRINKLAPKEFLKRRSAERRENKA